MGGLVARWDQFADETRAAVEQRIIAGIPRDLFPEQAFEDEDHWLLRYQPCSLPSASSAWKERARFFSGAKHRATFPPRSWNDTQTGGQSPGDRDDFHSWHESSSGPMGEVDLLGGVPESSLVEEALRIQEERCFEQGDLWRKFCEADPERALRGLVHDATGGSWKVEAWRSLFWATGENITDDLRQSVAEQVLNMPEATLGALRGTLADWLRRDGAYLIRAAGGDRHLFWAIWERLAAVTFCATEVSNEPTLKDVGGRALNEAAGVLAQALMDQLTIALRDHAS